MKLFRITSPSGETWLFWATNAADAKNKAQARAQWLHPDRDDVTFANMTSQEDGNLIAALQVGDEFIENTHAEFPVGKLNAGNLQGFKDALQSTGEYANQGIPDLNRLRSYFGADVAASQISGGETTSPTARQPGDPVIPEGAMPSVAWDRALQDIGMGGGLSRTIAAPYRGALDALTSIGFAGGQEGGIFGNLAEGRERQGVYTNALRNMLGGGTGDQGSWSLTQAAKNLFNTANTADERLKQFFDPNYLEDQNAYKRATQVAELALAGLGRGRFGSLGGYLPSAGQLVSDYGAQRYGTGESDLREYIRGRLGAGSAFTG